MARSGPEAWLGQLDAWLGTFLAALPRAEPRRWAPLYVRGLLLPGERKSVAPMAARGAGQRAAAAPLRLHLALAARAT